MDGEWFGWEVKFDHVLTIVGNLFLFLGCKYHRTWDNFVDAQEPHNSTMVYPKGKDIKAFISHCFSRANLPPPQGAKNWVRPKLIKKGKTNYPLRMQAAGIQGKVDFLVRIKRDGGVEELGIYRYNRKEFIEASRKRILTAKYEKNKEDRFIFISCRFGSFVPTEGTCNIHGSVDGILSLESGYNICPLCYPQKKYKSNL